jgi:hypothetical protein
MSKKKKLAPKEKKSRYDEFDDDEFVRRYERLDDEVDDYDDEEYDDEEYDEDEYDDDEFES